MIDMFEKKLCSCCKNENCNHNIVITVKKNIVTYKCNEYIKNPKKLVPYKKPLIVTAKRDYVTEVDV